MRFALPALLVFAFPFGVMAEEKFASKEGKYTVSFPKAPLERSREVDSPTGKLKIFVAQVTLRPDFAIFVLYNDMPDSEVKRSTTKELLDKNREGIKGPTGKILEEKDLELGDDKIPGRFMLIESETGVAQVRAFVKGNRLYMLMVGTQKKEDAISAEAKKFLDSFEITK
ncbi:MAG: hypothetical protein K8T89_06140 [Planctomycetes bacterium]|nr:hypothetical protein [Planctomycetota bacterium]